MISRPYGGRTSFQNQMPPDAVTGGLNPMMGGRMGPSDPNSPMSQARNRFGPGSFPGMMPPRRPSNMLPGGPNINSMGGGMQDPQASLMRFIQQLFG